ncbi:MULTISPECIES: HalOD1 output domain-containing protein [Haloferax]|uniref:Halobacterial output domain-containing protein n=2 Tax=Haloferax TaxID=2251 RepID=A0A6G1Z6C9_9EURY|nr:MULTISPECIES: HalOD1 output domain-containing protein [Haloferax]KAB1185316.1 hypothetical protein Hfx1149_14735 [Haloferax sp. CBA1149]MRW81951.1 hypothetical protein [Haloferax marinisediminis]
MSDHSVSEAVLAAIAEAEGVDVKALDTPLYESISPEALDKLFRNSPVEVTFRYMGYIVTVTPEQEVELVSIDDR